MRRKCVFFKRDEGWALVEFAIILGLIMLSGAAAILCLGNESEKTFAVLAQWNGDGAAVPPIAPADAEFVEAVEEEESNTQTLRREAHSSRQIRIDHRSLTAIFSGLALLGYVASRRRRLHERRVLEQLDHDREIVERVDNKRFVKRQEILRVLAADPNALLENRLEVRHLMSTPVRTVGPKTTLDEMRSIIEAEQVRHFPVVTEKGLLVGVVSDRDLIGTQARFAADAMTRTLIAVSPTTKLNSALAQIINRNLTCLPVMQQGQLVGLLTTTELVMTLQCALQLTKRKARPAASPAEQALV